MTTARTRLIACLVPAILSGAACDIGLAAGGPEGMFDRELTVSGPVELEVQSGSGDIQVRTGSDSGVHVHGRVRASGGFVSFSGESAADHIHRIEANPPIEQSGNTITVGERNRTRGWDGISISYEITVPANTRVKANSGSGDLTIGEVAGPVTVSTGSGDIRVTRIAEAVQARSGSGEIEVGGARSVVANTGSGNVRASAVRGDVEARSGSGDISVAQEAAGEANIGTGSGNVTLTGARGAVRAHTSSGDVTIEGAPAAEWEISASSGDVRLRLPAQAAFDLNAHTGSGHIDTSLPITTSGRLAKNELRGQVRGGGPRVQVSTSSGSIEIR